MSLLTLDEAAIRLGVPRQTIEDWMKRGLLASEHPSVPPGCAETYVEEDQLLDVAESL
jgi:predicted site-specific integrase-resolvase